MLYLCICTVSVCDPRLVCIGLTYPNLYLISSAVPYTTITTTPHQVFSCLLFRTAFLSLFYSHVCLVYPILFSLASHTYANIHIPHADFCTCCHPAFSITKSRPLPLPHPLPEPAKLILADP